MIEQKFLDIDGLAEYTHLSKATIYKKVSLKEIPFIKIGRRTVFDIQRIDRWMYNGGRNDDEIPELPNLK